MKEHMQKLQRTGNKVEASELREEISRLLLRDAEYVYGESAEQARLENRSEEEHNYREEALRIRACLPHFNIEGLWVGK